MTAPRTPDPVSAATPLPYPGMVRLEPSGMTEGSTATVPQPTALGAAGPLSILSVSLDKASKPAKLTIETRAGQPVDLFAEGPANWYLPIPQKGATPGSFVLPLEGLPKAAALSGTALHLTLSTGSGGIETVYTLP